MLKIPEYLSEVELKAIIERSSVGLTPGIKTALLQAIRSHEHQIREDGKPYLNEHIYPVTAMVIEFLGDRLSEDAIVVALLHDALEDDSNFSHPLLEEAFGSDVAVMVLSLTKPNVDEHMSETERRQSVNVSYFQNLQNASLTVKYIKLLDRIDNLYWAITFGEELVNIYIHETNSFYVPFAKSINSELHAVMVELLDTLQVEASKANYS